MKLNLRAVLSDARKAVGALAAMETAAASLGLLSHAQAAAVTAILGPVTSIVVYLLRNDPSARHLAGVDDTGPGSSDVDPNVPGEKL